MLKLKHSVADIAIICSDFEKSLKFYRDQLGLEVALDISIPDSTAQGARLTPSGFRQLRLRLGETLIKLAKSNRALNQGQSIFRPECVG